MQKRHFAHQLITYITHYILIMNKNTTNGLRWYFLEAFLSKTVSNIKDFAALTNVPKSSMQRYLNGVGPRTEEVLRDIERALGKPAYDMCSPRTMLNWEKLVPKLYSNKPTLRNRYHYEDAEEESMIVREDFQIEYPSTDYGRLQRRCEDLAAENERLKKENEMLQLALSSLEFDERHSLTQQ